jgi:uncharacterized C2H2 Zn-finger protein
MENKECTLLTNKNILIYTNDDSKNKKIDYYIKNFCGKVFSNMTDFTNSKYLQDTLVYFCGDVKNYEKELNNLNNLYIVEDLSTNFDKKTYNVIKLEELPINIFDVGIFFKNFFDSNKDYFDLLTKEHNFQSLTESNKGSSAFRTGIYITKVMKDNNDLKFKLLRCSSNFDGPTDNFRNTDIEIVSKVNFISKYYFKESAELNHVLAQVYQNHVQKNNVGLDKEKKAKIKEHSDKTKDMSSNGLLAFCTFYKENKKYDDTALTKLRFRMKDDVDNDNFVGKFDVILYPNSVFLVPLSTNRLYTHEIIPSSKSIKDIPTRLGYVIRCSKTEAIYKNDKTYILDENKEIELVEPDDEGIKNLKYLYYQENLTPNVIEYEKIYFSLNKGDYMKPLL